MASGLAKVYKYIFNTTSLKQYPRGPNNRTGHEGEVWLLDFGSVKTEPGVPKKQQQR